MIQVPFSFFRPLKTFAEPSVCQPITTTINQSSSQIDPTGSVPVKFTVVFSLPTIPSTFLLSQIELTGTAPGKSVFSITEITPNDGTTFEIAVLTTGNGTVVASVKDASYVSSILGAAGNFPDNTMIDQIGNVYIPNAVPGNVSKITSGGVSTILGTSGSGPVGVVMDQSGNIYTANRFSNNVSKLTKTGILLVSGCLSPSNQLVTNFALPSTSTDNTVTIDTTPTPITGTPDLATSSDSGFSNTDNTTNDTTPSFDITCQAGSTVTLYESSNSVATKPCPVENIVSITLESTLTSGTYYLNSTQTNSLEVLSNISGILYVTLDTTAPAAPVGQCTSFFYKPNPNYHRTVSIAQKDLAGNIS